MSWTKNYKIVLLTLDIWFYNQNAASNHIEQVKWFADHEFLYLWAPLLYTFDSRSSSILQLDLEELHWGGNDDLE